MSRASLEEVEEKRLMMLRCLLLEGLMRRWACGGEVLRRRRRIDRWKGRWRRKTRMRRNISGCGNFLQRRASLYLCLLELIGEQVG